MQKYLQVLSVGIQNTLAYRLNFFFRAAFNLVPLAATIFLWRTIYASKSENHVAGYELAQMISYYIIVSLVDALTAVNEDDWQIAAEIRDGMISQFLLKPMDYLTYRMVLYIAGRMVYVIICFLPLGAFVLYYRNYLQLPSEFSIYLYFIIALLMTALLQFLISYTMALLAFWILEIDTFIFILFAMEYLAGGHLFPLDILPKEIAAMLTYTPFPYLLYFPVSIFIGRTIGQDIAMGLVMQAIWVAIAYLLARSVWRRGISKYAAVGG